MKQKINLLQVPNQAFSCNLSDDEGNFYMLDMTLRTLPDNNLIANITIDNESVISGVNCCNNMPLIPNNRLNGNIYFTDVYENSDPNYTGFNEQYLLIYDTEFKLG